MEFDNRCAHERGEKTVNIEVLDYAPLTRGELRDILAAVDAKEADVHKAQVRLIRAVPGMTCPRPIKGLAAKMMTAINKIYVRAVQGGRALDAFDEIEAVLELSTMSEFKPYRRSQIAYLRPYVEGEVLSDRVSISPADREAGSPKVGDMIARNLKNPDDQWLVAAAYFADNFEPVE